MQELSPPTLPWWRNPESRRWILLTVPVKCLLALVISILASRLSATDGYRLYNTASGDTASYLDPAENLLARGEYADGRGVRAGRMPGYSFTYLPFRAFMSRHVALTTVAALQVIVSGISTYYLALTAFLVFRRRAVFYSVLALYGLNLFVSLYDTAIQTESLAASAVIFFLHLLVRFRTERRLSYLVGAGCAFAYAVFLRPFAAPLGICAVLLLWPQRGTIRQGLTSTLRNLAIFALPLVVLDGAWIARNFVVLKRLIPMQVNTLAGYPYTPSELALFGWLKAVGHEVLHWNPDTMASWFHRDPRFTNEHYVVPPYVVTSRCSLHDVQVAREAFFRADEDFQPDPRIRQSGETVVMETLGRCERSFKAEKPLHYHLLSPLRIMKRLLVHAGPVLPLPAFHQIRHRLDLVALKLGGAALYWLALVGGIIGILLSLRSRRPEPWALAFPGAYLILFLSFVIRHSESRLLVIGFPSLCLFGGVTLAGCFTWLQARLPRHRQVRTEPGTSA